MNKTQKEFYEKLKMSYPDEIRNGIDVKFHVKGKLNASPVIYGEEIKYDFQKSFMTDFGKRGQAYAIFSSAIMAYNFFHWVGKDNPIDLGQLGVYDEVVFEFPLRTFKSRKSSAKMDVVLLNRETARVLFIESKFTEHFSNKKFVIPEAYVDASNYFPDGYGDEWVSIVNSCKNTLSQHGGYGEGIKQEICHLVGICASKTTAYTGRSLMGSDYRWCLRNVVFKPKAEACIDTPYDNYKTLYDKFKEHVANKISGMDIGIMDYKPIWNAIRKAFPDENDPYREFIWNRYMQFAADEVL